MFTHHVSQDSKELLLFRHPIMLVHHFAKAILLIGCAGLLVYTFRNSTGISSSIMGITLGPIALILFNYGMGKLILSLLYYTQKFVVIYEQSIHIFENTLFLQEDVEVINREKIVKIDVEQHGILSTLLKYGNIVIEQQRNEVRIIHCLYKPFEVVRFLHKNQKTEELTAFQRTKESV